MRVSARAIAEAGFFRCGKHWGRAGSTHEVTRDEFAVLQAEPALIDVAVVRDAPAKDRAPAADGVRDAPAKER